MNIVWFKKDLRITDHEPLSHALNQGPFIALYIFEPELFNHHDYSYRHFLFLKDSLTQLHSDLEKLSISLIIKIGDAPKIFHDIHTNTPIQTIFSHQETGNQWTFKRDKAVHKWCKTHHITWLESKQFGIVRALKNRDGWSKQWHAFMSSPIITTPKKTANASQIISSHYIDELDTYVKKIPNLDLQKGGSSNAHALLTSFLESRGARYHKEMSSPVTAFESCSRLSPHLSHGTISLKTIYQTINTHKLTLKSLSKSERGTWIGALSAILGRLRWHCHFMQKLEDEPSIEFKNLHPAHDMLEKKLNTELFEAWKTGNTGFPMVDACMRALVKTGWLNFRMRAMLTSFACHHLWLPWQPVSHYLAQCFTDYEPGIHYSQIQMQAGSTGINTIRIYNPIKQALDHDPHCLFIKQWIPELLDSKPELIHIIHESNLFNTDYIPAIIDEKIARNHARSELFSLRKSTSFKKTSVEIVKKHGSRKKTNTNSKLKKEN